MQFPLRPLALLLALPGAVASHAAISGAHAGFPFPIPKTGNEAMWNHLVRFNGPAYESKYRNLNVDANGHAALATEGNSVQEYPFWDNAKTEAETYWRMKLTYTGPA